MSKYSITDLPDTALGLAIPKMHLVDIAKIKTLEDVKLIIDSLQISFGTDHYNFDEIKHLLEDTPL